MSKTDSQLFCKQSDIWPLETGKLDSIVVVDGQHLPDVSVLTDGA